MALGAGTRGIHLSGGGPRLAAAAIFKNEGPYVLEWVAHHRALGIGRFFIADNDSTDETTATLAALARVGIVEHLPYPTQPGRPPQQAAYEAIIRRYQAEADWIVFLDADEFLVPAAHRSLAETMAAINPGRDVGAIAVNWAIYGSAGRREAEGGPVAIRFDRRAEQAHPANRHYKSIVRPTAVEGTVQTPHHFPLKPGYRNIHPDGGTVADVPGLPKGLSRRILWAPMRINHYVIKSWDEFCYRKRARGRATRTDKLRDENFFRAHDRNDVLDPMPAWLALAAEAERRRIEAVLRTAGPLAGAPRSAGRGFAAWRTRLSTLLQQDGPRGLVEAIEIQGDTALIRGWALTPRQEAAEDFVVAVGERPVVVASLVKTPRSDVIARFPNASADCGFNLKIAWPTPPKDGTPRLPLMVTARYASGRFFPVPAAEAAWLLPSRRPAPETPASPAARLLLAGAGRLQRSSRKLRCRLSR